ncbi:MAG: glycosyltransferase family 2 protein [Phycisphaerales bacterium]
MPTLHVVIPFFNEERTLDPCVRRAVLAALPSGWGAALVLVDDCSVDSAHLAARGLVERLRAERCDVLFLRHDVNRGKGAAIRSGFDAVLARARAEPRRGQDVVVIQDADLEYDPRDFAALLAPLIERRADAVYGNRWGPRWRAADRRLGVRRLVHRLGNGVLTAASNLLTGVRVDDMECCYKLLPVELLGRVRPHLTEDRFGIEPQITAVLGRLGARVAQVDVAYAPRGFKEGKKIGVRDAFRALWVLTREKLRRPPSTSSGQHAADRH